MFTFTTRFLESWANIQLYCPNFCLSSMQHATNCVEAREKEQAVSARDLNVLTRWT